MVIVINLTRGRITLWPFLFPANCGTSVSFAVLSAKKPKVTTLTLVVLDRVAQVSTLELGYHFLKTSQNKKFLSKMVQCHLKEIRV